MKVAIDISASIYGTGVSVYTRNLVTSLIKNFPSDEYLLFGGSLRRKKELDAWTKRLNCERRFFHLPPRFMDFVWNSLHLFNVEKLVGNVDLIHTSDWAEPPSHLPKVTTVHDLVPFRYPSTTADNIRAAHRKRLAWVAKESAMIIAVSETTKSDLVSDLNIPASKIAVIYEGVEDRYCPQPLEIVELVKKKHHIEGEYLFCLSTLEPRKNQKKLIEAFLQLKPQYPDLKLVIGGRFGWGDQLQVPEGVIATGFIQDADLPALYSGCLAYVLPSLYEGFSLSHLQAMSCGAAVLGSNVSSMPEVIGTAGVLVDPQSVEAIVAGIIQAISNNRHYAKLGLERAKLFTWDKTARSTHNIYQQVLGK